MITIKTNSIIELQNISYTIGRKHILRDISFRVKKNEIITIVGKNGAGKSTLCKIIIGALAYTQGNLYIKPNLKISYIPQINQINTLVPIRVLDFILTKNKKILSTQDLLLAERLKLTTIFFEQLKELSGGEKQKVMLFRALISNPNLLILDEPISFIDFSAKNDLYSLINEYKNLYNFSVLLVSHDLNIVLKNTDWVVCINDGKIGCSGQPHHINTEESFSSVLGEDYLYYKHKDQ